MQKLKSRQPVEGASIYQRQGWEGLDKWLVTIAVPSKVLGTPPKRTTRVLKLPYPQVIEWAHMQTTALEREKHKLPPLPAMQAQAADFPVSLFPTPRESTSPSAMLNRYKMVIAAKGTTGRHQAETFNKIHRLFEVGDIRLASDLTETKVILAFGKLLVEGLSHSTLNHYRTALKGFYRWACKDYKLAPAAFDDLPLYNSQADPRRSRTSFAIEEFITLVQTAIDGPTWRPGCICGDIPGIDRAALYMAAGATGLRESTLARLMVQDFRLGQSPHVLVNGAVEKSRKRRMLELREDHAAWLGAYLSSKMPTALAFRTPTHACDFITMLEFDLKRAGIQMCEVQVDGKVKRRFNVKDFHSLRHSHITWCAQSGVAPQTVQQRAGHSSMELTMKTYTHIPNQEQLFALKHLPRVPEYPALAQRNGG